jgi:hypothetical protein
VVPDPIDDAYGDYMDLLARVDILDFPAQLEDHPYLLLAKATAMIAGTNNHVLALLAPDVTTTMAFFGLEGEPPKEILGMRLIYDTSEGGPRFPDRLVVLGGPTHHLDDAQIGVLIYLEI